VEKLSSFEFLISKLPAPETPIFQGILQAIDMDSYGENGRAQVQLPDADAEIGPVPTAAVDERLSRNWSD